VDVAFVGCRLQSVDLVPGPGHRVSDKSLDGEGPLRRRKIRRRLGCEHRPVGTDVVLAWRKPGVAYCTAATLELPCEFHESLPDRSGMVSPFVVSRSAGSVPREFAALKSRHRTTAHQVRSGPTVPESRSAGDVQPRAFIHLLPRPLESSALPIVLPSKVVDCARRGVNGRTGGPGR